MTQMTGNGSGTSDVEASHFGHPSREELIAQLHQREQEIREHLNALNPVSRRARLLPTDDPVRTKNLEKIATQLQDLLYFVAQEHDRLLPENQELLGCLLAQLAAPRGLSANNAWELADAMEVMLVRLGDDPYVRRLILNEFPRDLPESLRPAHPASETGNDATGAQSLDMGRAREYLVQRRRAQAHEYRRDRAKMRLRQRQLLIMAAVLLTLLTLFSVALVWAEAIGSVLLLLVLFAGAVGSVLSRAIQLSKQPLRAGEAPRPGDVRPQEVPLGIRALISAWTVFVAQPVLGATAALILSLVFTSGLLQVGGLAQLNTATLALLAFLAGYSEPFFTDILGKVAEKAGGSLG
ncbi:hypothetical protein D7V97_07350 [Corallococcus sp. CA053C]|uniref:hypothetical protein n=1 Tax=Corallococcus sp. CA053C TaxID=2316732 RepID=UPI000EA31BE7|nr:hypothetical protein [Corallococcus sp. CA053C]RKH12778.1 hypothetical protein D7V97_07350 [Corallococcus sp. CA053C]